MQEVVASWLKYHARCEPICRQIRELPARADALTADCPERPATLDALRDWRQRAEPMIAEARAMPEKDGPHAPHLAAMPDERGALVKAKSSLESALLAVKAREKNVLSAVVQTVGGRVPPRLERARGRGQGCPRRSLLRGRPHRADRPSPATPKPACRYGAARQRTGADRLHPRRSPAARPSPLTRQGISGPDRALPHPAASAKRTRPYPEIGAPRRPLLQRMARRRRAPPRGGEGHRR